MWVILLYKEINVKCNSTLSPCGYGSLTGQLSGVLTGPLSGVLTGALNQCSHSNSSNQWEADWAFDIVKDHCSCDKGDNCLSDK